MSLYRTSDVIITGSIFICGLTKGVGGGGWQREGGMWRGRRGMGGMSGYMDGGDVDGEKGYGRDEWV